MGYDFETQHRRDVGDGTIEFFDRGDGEPLLLVHAGAFAAWFPALAAQLAMSGFRLVQPVRLGYSSPAPARHLTLADHAAHCAAVLDGLGIGQAHVLGHSSGSLIGLQLAVDRPDLVRSLVLVEPAPATSLVPPDMAEAGRERLLALAAVAASGDLSGAFRTFMARFGSDYADVLAAVLGPPGALRAERDCGFFFRDEILAVLEWTLDDASRVRAPALLVKGDVSPVFDADVTGLAARLPDAEVVTVEGADHLLPLRDPAALARLTAGFVERQRMPAA